MEFTRWERFDENQRFADELKQRTEVEMKKFVAYWVRTQTMRTVTKPPDIDMDVAIEEDYEQISEEKRMVEEEKRMVEEYLRYEDELEAYYDQILDAIMWLENFLDAEYYDLFPEEDIFRMDPYDAQMFIEAQEGSRRSDPDWFVFVEIVHSLTHYQDVL